MNKLYYFINFIVCLCLTTVLYFHSSSNILNRLECITLDCFFEIRPSVNTSDQILVIDIDEKSIAKLGPWPWSREVFAFFLSALGKYSPDLVFLDVFFSEEFPVIDSFLIGACQENKKVCLPVIFNGPSFVKPSGSAGETEKSSSEESAFFLKLGFNSFNQDLSRIWAKEMVPIHYSIYDAVLMAGHGQTISDEDGIVRRVPLFVHYKDVLIPQLVLSGIMEYNGVARSKIYLDAKRKTLVIPGKDTKSCLKIPVNKNGECLINWAGSWDNAYTKISFADFIDAHEAIKKGQNPKINIKDLIKNRICFVGLTAKGLIDIKPTPVDKHYPMLGVHINLLNSLLEKQYLREAGPFVKLFCILFLPLLPLIHIGILKRKHFVFSYLLFIIIWPLIGFLLFIFYSYLVPVMLPIIGAISCLLLVLIFHYFWSQKEARKLMKQAITDELTGLYTHRFFKYKLEKVFLENDRLKSPFSLILFDIDNFKNINDTYGHQEGNEVLKTIGGIILENGNEPKIFNFRYGGEEFAVLLLNTTKQEAYNYSENLLEAVRKKTFQFGQTKLCITVSLGLINSIDSFSDKVEDFLKAADSAMFQAKKMGKNQVVYFDRDHFNEDDFSPKFDFGQKKNDKDHSMLEFVAVDLQKRNEELETILNKMQSMQNRILKHEKEAVTRQMTAYISHELNKPMHNMLNCLKRVQRFVGENPNAKHFLTLMHQEILRVIDLSYQMLNFYRPSKQKKEMTDINELLQALLTVTQDQIENKNICLKIVLSPDLPKIYCSGEELKQVFLNILINAIEAVSLNGLIEVKTVFFNENIEIVFYDNGHGIPKEISEKIFTPFFSTKEEIGGTGLGLAVSLKIIKKYNGTLIVESEEGNGTLFKIKLPVITFNMI